MSTILDDRKNAGPKDAGAEPRVIGFGAPGQSAAATGGFGRRKTPIPATTDGVPPAAAANDSAVGSMSDGAAGDDAAGDPMRDVTVAESAGTNHPFFVDRRDEGMDATLTYDGPLSVTDETPTELVAWLSGELRKGRRVQQDSVLCALGALAGYAAQQAIHESVVKTGRLTLDQAFVLIETRSGEMFFFGDLLNTVLGATDASKSTSQFTVWKIIADGAKQAGATTLPDLQDIVKHCAATVGSPEFGLPRLHSSVMPELMPRDAVNRFWQPARRKLSHAGAMSWPLHLAMAAHKMIIECKEEIRPDLAARIVMEAAIPMSKIDPLTVPKG